MLKKYELLKRLYDQEKDKPCFCIAENGLILWANQAAMMAIPTLLPEKPVEEVLPECFPSGFHPDEIAEKQAVCFADGDAVLMLTRFHISRGDDFFEALYIPNGVYYPFRADSSRDGMMLMTSCVRQKSERMFTGLGLIADELENIQEDYWSTCPLLSKQIDPLLERLHSIEMHVRAEMAFAMQLEEYYRFPTRTEMHCVPVDAGEFFSSLFHDVQIYTMDTRLDFQYHIEPLNERWELMIDKERYTAALLGMFRVSCISALRQGEGSLRAEVRMEDDSMVLKLRDTVTDPMQLEKDEVLLPCSGRSVPTLERISCDNLKRLTELQGGQWVLGSAASESGFQLQIRFPAVRSGEIPLNSDPGYTSAPWPDTLSGQRGLIQTMFAQLDDTLY